MGSSSALLDVAILASNFWPEPTGSSQTVTEFAEYLRQRGAEVRVATSMPYYPQWEIWPEYRGVLWRTDRYKGIHIFRSWHMVSPQPSTLGRLLHEVTLSLCGLPNMIRALRGADLALIVCPALSYAFTGALLAVAMGVPRVLVVKDVMPDAAVELGMLTNPAIIMVARWLARLVYGFAEEIHTLGEGMRRRIASASTLEKPIRLVPDTIDGNELQPVPRERNEFRRRFVPSGVFAVVHTGNMGKKQDLDLLLRTADRLRHEDGIQFYVFGDGADGPRFLARRAAMGLENVSHYPLQERWMLAHILSGADVVLVSQLSEVVDIVVPSKLITSLGAGAMVIAACAATSEAAWLLRTSDGGIIVPPGDDRALAEQIQRVRSGEVDVARCRRDARSFALRAFERQAVYGPVVDELVLRYASSRRKTSTAKPNPSRVGV